MNGRLNANRPLPVIDGLLAATAKIHRMTLVTRNTADARPSQSRAPFFGGASNVATHQIHQAAVFMRLATPDDRANRRRLKPSM